MSSTWVIIELDTEYAGGNAPWQNQGKWLDKMLKIKQPGVEVQRYTVADLPPEVRSTLSERKKV